MRIWVLITFFTICFSCGKEATSKVVSSEKAIAVNPELINLDERHYLVLRQELPLDNMTGFFGIESEALMNKAKDAGIEPTGPISALFYRWDTEVGIGDAAVALPVKPGSNLAGYVEITLPAQRAFTAECVGPYTGLGAIHYALGAQFEIEKVKPATPSIEVYHKGPLDGINESEFRTQIIYPIQE